MSKLKKQAIEIMAVFWLVIVAVQFLYRTPLLADFGTDYKFVYIAMAVIAAVGMIRAVLEYLSGERGEACEPASCITKRDGVHKQRRSRR